MTTLALQRLATLRHHATQLNSAWLLIAAIPLLLAIFDRAQLSAILQIAAAALISTAPYIAIAVLLIAYLKASSAEAVIARAFIGRETRMIVLAALFGGLAPFCSCEVIPFIAALLAVGAPLSAVMAFWLSSPLIDPPTVLITASALGWDFAIGKTIAAVSLGLMGGFAMSLLTRHGFFSLPLRVQTASSGCGCGPSPFEGKPAWKFWQSASRRQMFGKETAVNALFLLKWLLLAYLLEALLITYVPAQTIGSMVGGEGFMSIVIGAIVGAPAYLNGYAAPALVSGLMDQGMNAGAAMAFMVAGAVSSIPAMAAVWSLVKRPVFAAYLGFGIGGAILCGSLFALLRSSL